MKALIQKHKEHWADRSFSLSVLSGFLFLALGLVLNYFAGAFANQRASNAVTDIILDNLPVWQVGVFFVDGAVIFGILVILILIQEPKRIPFVVKSVALFVVIRSFFISLTHLGPSPGMTPLDLNRFLGKLTFGGDLFFSGHTGLPFLLALIFWRNFRLRIFFLAASLFFAIITLLGHLHYSIDVFAAFFITYAIFHLAQWFFPKDYKLFLGGLK